MASRLKKLLCRSKSTKEDKSLAKLEASLTGAIRLSPSQSVSRKERKETTCTKESKGPHSDRNTNARRTSIRFHLRQKRYSPELCSPCSSPEMGFCLEQNVPLLSGKRRDTKEISDAPSPQDMLEGSVDQCSYESLSDSLKHFEEIAHGQSEVTPESPSDQKDDLHATDHDMPQPYDSLMGLNLVSTKQLTRWDSSQNLMEVLSHHQIEWSAMTDFITSSNLQGFSPRQIRWLIRQSRYSKWLVGTLGPLLEERSEVMELNL